MIRAAGARLRRSSSTVVALVLLLLLVGGIALFSIDSLRGGSSEVFSSGDDAVARASVEAIALGTPRDEVERRLGPGRDALDFEETGVALEPLDAECIYYPQAATGNYRDIFQLCFRDGRLVRKRAYAATPGAPLL
jgi:hypothetical protein